MLSSFRGRKIRAQHWSGHLWRDRRTWPDPSEDGEQLGGGVGPHRAWSPSRFRPHYNLMEQQNQVTPTAPSRSHPHPPGTMGTLLGHVSCSVCAPASELCSSLFVLESRRHRVTHGEHAWYSTAPPGRQSSHLEPPGQGSRSRAGCLRPGDLESLLLCPSCQNEFLDPSFLPEFPSEIISC